MPFEWKDISKEHERVYYFADGSQFLIRNPQKLAIAASGSHRVVDDQGHTFWVRPDFNAIRWEGPTDF